MNKRSDQKKHRRGEFKQGLKKVSAILFCIVLLIFFINTADLSTRRMIMCNDDKYAMTVSFQERNQLRLDIAGEKLIINIEPVVKLADSVIYNSKRYYEGIVKAIRTKSGT